MTPYRLNLVLKRLRSTSIFPVEMSANFVFMELCSVRLTSILYCIVGTIVMFISFFFAVIISKLLPLLTNTSLDPTCLPQYYSLFHIQSWRFFCLLISKERTTSLTLPTYLFVLLYFLLSFHHLFLSFPTCCSLCLS